MPANAKSDLLRTPNGNVVCKVCDYGTLERRNLRDGTGTAIGWVLGALGLGLCAFSAFDTLRATVTTLRGDDASLGQAVAVMALGTFANYWLFWFVVGAAMLAAALRLAASRRVLACNLCTAVTERV